MKKKQFRYINDAKSSTSVSTDEVTQGFFFGGGATFILHIWPLQSSLGTIQTKVEVGIQFWEPNLGLCPKGLSYFLEMKNYS